MVIISWAIQNKHTHALHGARQEVRNIWETSGCGRTEDREAGRGGPKGAGNGLHALVTHSHTLPRQHAPARGTAHDTHAHWHMGSLGDLAGLSSL